LFRSHLVSLNCRYTHSCMALFYVRCALERHLPGSAVRISQYTINDPYFDTLLRLSTSPCDALFFSAYIWNGMYIERLVRDLTAIRPDLPLILGGPQAVIPKDLPEQCTVVEGEIEGVDERFYQDLKNGCLQVRYRAVSAGPFPFPYREEDFAVELRTRQVYYESSRGCPFRCSYCLSSADHDVRYKDVRTVEQELERILVHEPKIIRFVDRTFNDRPERALHIWRFLAGRPGNTRFHFEVAPDRFTDEMLAFLETVPQNRFQFEAGIQSINPETLDAVSRRMNVEQAEANIRRLAAMDNIHLHVDLILGLPFDSEISYRRSLNRVFALQPHYIQMGLLKILPGTPISRETARHGMIHCRQPPYEILANRWLDHPALCNLHVFGEGVEAFYNNRYFRTLWRYLLDTEEEPFQFFLDLLAVCRDHHFYDRSPTQELMARMLVELAAGRADAELVLDILRYDWLRCGHRFLPAFLETTPLSELRAALREKLPPSLEGHYAVRERSEFLKRCMFLEMTAPALRQIGFAPRADRAVVCFLPEWTGGVMRHCRTMLLD
jgi:hypothetical protein